MPRAVDAVEVDESEPLVADDLEVVARNRLTPPRLLDTPLIADLDPLAPARPGNGNDPPIVELHRNRWMGTEETGHLSLPTEADAQTTEVRGGAPRRHRPEAWPRRRRVMRFARSSAARA